MNDMAKPGLPNWVPSEVFRYLEHTIKQVSIRKLAKREGCHPSTVMRQIRRQEQLRDDPLVDGALTQLARVYYNQGVELGQNPGNIQYSEGDAARFLAVLAQSGAVLVVGRDMPKGVILREIGAETHKTIIERGLAEVIALLNWISCISAGQVLRYRLTRSGREALVLMQARIEAASRARAETTTQSGIAGMIAGAKKDLGQTSRRNRYGLQETPLQTLARLTDRDGEPFLTPEMIRAGERLREDFELAQIGHHVVRQQNVFSDQPCQSAQDGKAGPARAAFQRASEALCALGPGLSDIALRCCCHLEGLEAAEKELGWSARSGKIVLRIALEQLQAHYQRVPPQSQMIG